MAHLRFVRRHVEVQGFFGLSDAELARVAPWLRFTPTANLLVIATATALASPGLLAAAVLLMVFGAVSRAHPFDSLYNRVVAPLAGSPRLPRSADRRRFVFAIAAAWLAGTAVAFQMGHATVGYVLGGLAGALAVPLATAHVCLISEPMERLFGPARAPRAE